MAAAGRRAIGSVEADLGRSRPISAHIGRSRPISRCCEAHLVPLRQGALEPRVEAQR